MFCITAAACVEPTDREARRMGTVEDVASSYSKREERDGILAGED